MAQAGAELLVETLNLLAEGRSPRTPQDHSLATFAPPIKPDDSLIRWEEWPRSVGIESALCLRGQAHSPR